MSAADRNAAAPDAADPAAAHLGDRAPNVLFLGPAALDDFTPVLDFFGERVAPDQIRTADDVSGLAALMSDGWYPDLIVVLQSWPDQFSAADVHHVLARCPLARLVCCFGPWCDSDARTRSVWPLATRVPVAAAGRRLARELALFDLRSGSLAPLPLTASRTEIFEFDFDGPPDDRQSSLQGTTVKVISPDREFRQMLEAAVRTRGGAGCDNAAGRPDLIFFDADPWDHPRSESLQAIRREHPETKLVACVGFPRPDLEAALRAAGADSLWFKLSPLANLGIRCAGS